MYAFTDACPGIRKGGGQNLIAFYFIGGGAAQKIADKMGFSTKKSSQI